MAETLTLEAAPRSATGKANKALRRSGRVPLHVYGHGIPSLALEADEKAVRHSLHQAGATGIIKLSAGGRAHNVMVRKVQRHPVTGSLIHVDLYQVRMDEKTRVRVPLTFVGEAPGVKIHDGILLHQIEAVQVEALPGDIPHSIEVDISILAELDQALHVRDLVTPAAVRIIDEAEEIVVKVQPPRKTEEVAAVEVAEAAVPAAAEAPAAETPAEPMEEAPAE